MFHTMGIKHSNNPRMMGIKGQHAAHTMGNKTHMVLNTGSTSAPPPPRRDESIHDHSQLSQEAPIGLKHSSTKNKKSYLEKK